jgi:hypothetical protein
LADRPLPSDFTPQLRRIVESFALTGMGPAEAEVEGTLASGEPARLHALGAKLEALYPADLRRFLDGKGFGRLYREDLAGAADRLARASPDARPGPQAGRRSRQGRRRSAGLRVALLLTIGVGALAVWYVASLDRRQVPPDPGLRPRSGETVATAPPAVAAPPPSSADRVCRARLKADAVAWCSRTFGGLREPIVGVDPERPLACGDTLAVRAATVAIALDRLFIDGVVTSYADADVPARCEAAAETAVSQARQIAPD